MLDSKLKIKSDKPIEYIEDDIFNTSSFIDSLYDLLNNLTPERGFVISLNGEWGAGKSTILNFLKEKVIMEGNDCNFNIVEFLPWNIIDKQTLLKSFFMTLKNCIEKDGQDKKIVKLLGKYYTAIIEGLKIIPKVNLIVNFTEIFFSLFCKQKEQTIFDIKNEIINYLETKYNGKNIVILIDDLDRLTDEEICIVLKLIKEIADFPKLIYLISMDKKHVINAINNYYHYSIDSYKGNTYLEKFIQLERPLPQINKKIENLFIEEIRKIIDNNIYVNETFYFEEIFDNCIKEKLTTPRKVILFLNQYKTSYFRIEKYVNFVDYMIILFFQLFYPDFYIFLKQNKDILTCNYKYSGNIPTEYNQRQIDANLQGISCEEKYARKVLNYLFPNWITSCGSINNTYTANNDYIRNLIRCPEHFDKYFGQIDFNTKSTNEIIELINILDDNKILNYISYPNYQNEEDSINKAQYLFYSWQYLDCPSEQLEKILVALLKYSNNSTLIHPWFELLNQNVFQYFSRETFEHIFLKILIEENIINIYKSYIYILSSSNEVLTKKYISDNMCIQILQLYLNKILNSKRFPDLDEKIIINLFLKHKLYEELHKYLNKYKEHSAMLIYYLLDAENYQLQYVPQNLLEESSKNSESFWKKVGQGEFYYLKDFDKYAVLYIKKEKYKKYESIFGAAIEVVLKNYFKLTNIKI